MKTNPAGPFPKPQILATALVLVPLFACLLFFGCSPSKDTSPEPQKPDAAAPAAPATTAPATTAPATTAPAATAPAATAPAATAPATTAPATTAPAAAVPAAPTAADPAPAVAPGGLVRYDAQPVGSSAKMEGTSTIHDWSMKSAVIGGFLEVDPKFPESALTDPKAAAPNVQAFIPVRSFKSEFKRMDEVMQEHMNEPSHKRIEYKLIELKPKSAAGSTGALQFDAIGALTINGTTKTNTMPVTIEKKDGKLKVNGKTQLKMTDFGVKPPAPTILGMPTIKTGDDLNISFEWLAAPKAP